MAAILDILAAIIVGGALILISITASHTTVQELFSHNAAIIVQENLDLTGRILESDLNKIGFEMQETEQSNVLQIVQSNNLKFTAQLNLNPVTRLPVPGVTTFDDIPDTIEYKLVLAQTLTIVDSTLYLYDVKRIIKIASITTDSSNIGRIGNNNVFTYFDQAGNPETLIPKIRMLKINMTAFNPQIVLSPEMVMTNVTNPNDILYRKRELRRLLRGSYWKQNRFILRNLRK